MKFSESKTLLVETLQNAMKPARTSGMVEIEEFDTDLAVRQPFANIHHHRFSEFFPEFRSLPRSPVGLDSDEPFPCIEVASRPTIPIFSLILVDVT